MLLSLFAIARSRILSSSRVDNELSSLSILARSPSNYFQLLRLPQSPRIVLANFSFPLLALTTSRSRSAMECCLTSSTESSRLPGTAAGDGGIIALVQSRSPPDEAGARLLKLETDDCRTSTGTACRCCSETLLLRFAPTTHRPARLPLPSLPPTPSQTRFPLYPPPQAPFSSEIVWPYGCRGREGVAENDHVPLF